MDYRNIVDNDIDIDRVNGPLQPMRSHPSVV